mmetsp:Transcript_29460/g.26031  ORF Transcript_29460/g.26031 Transcript_29460/m.26031 type:complete len:122 (+) Transcript_29460:140-505(+)
MGPRSISLPEIRRPKQEMKYIKQMFKNAKRKVRNRSQKIPVKIIKTNISRKKKVKKRGYGTKSRKNSFLSRMEYSSTKSNRSLRSIHLEDIDEAEVKENSIIIEEKENDDSTKYSDTKRKI